MSNFKATNDFNLTRFAFYERLRYRIRAFENKNHTNLKNISFGELVYYGRIDYNLNPVYPEFGAMKLFDNGNYALNFVADAFSDVIRHFRSAYDFERTSITEKHLTN